MNHELQAGKNIAWGVVSQVFLRLFGLVFFVFMTYRLREAGMGEYGFVTSFVLFWFLISDFGAGGYLYREWSKGDNEIKKIEKDFNIVFSLRFFVGLIVFIPFIIINYYINRDLLGPLVLFFIVTFFSMFINLADSYLQAINYFKYTTIRTIIEKTTIVVLGFVLLSFWPKVEMVFLAMLIAQFISLAYYSFSVLPFKYKFIFDRERMKELIIKGLPFLLLVFFTSIYSRIDMIMLRYMDNLEAVGWYSASYKFLELATIITASLYLPSVFPILSSLYQKNKENFINFFYKSLRIIFSISLIIAVVVIFFAPMIVSLFFPESFSPSILAARILILSTILGGLSLLFNYLLFIQDKEKISLYIIIFSAILNIVLNLVLIKKYSLYGAAWATVLAEIVNLFLLQHFVNWKKDKKLILKMLSLVFVNILLMVLLKIIGELNNIFIGSGVIILNIYLIFKLALFTKGDLLMFINPIRNKFNNIFKSEEII